ncbi:17-beta-hydroxysteroid dehydrogenase 13-like isoform X2 [Chironomus tepperi]|uniref:17-beta-hydroxysteroid dehydrogenase 13-like isoform X2 n=1 Tax=Chironomus tepperi TaxID=113505 RepID=UPI00391FC721
MARAMDFRAQKVVTKSNDTNSWLKHIGKLGLPLQLLLKSYQFLVVWVDVSVLLVKTYFALIQSILCFILPSRRKNLSTEVAVVVGSSRGVGRELAYKLGKLHSTVICIDVQSPDDEIVSKDIQMDGGNAFYFQCDVTNREHVEHTISKIERDIGGISMLYHCCSIPSPRSVVTNPPSVKDTLDVSVTSYFYLLEAILPHMKSVGRGHIIFLTSVAAISGFTQQLALSVSQFAIQGLYESIVEELRISKNDKKIKTTLVHIYPFIISENLSQDIRFRVPGFFGSIRADVAADKIIDGVRQNATEISIPSYCLYISQVMKIMPRKVTLMLREFLDTGVDF